MLISHFTTVNPDLPQSVTSNSQISSRANKVLENQTEAAVVAKMKTSYSHSGFRPGFYHHRHGNPEIKVEKQIIAIYKVYWVMVEAFTDKNILDTNSSLRHRLEHEKLEAGVGSGIIKDCLTDFWNMFYTTKNLQDPQFAPHLPR